MKQYSSLAKELLQVNVAAVKPLSSSRLDNDRRCQAAATRVTAQCERVSGSEQHQQLQDYFNYQFSNFEFRLNSYII
jgi:hypothetical protein